MTLRVVAAQIARIRVRLARAERRVRVMESGRVASSGYRQVTRYGHALAGDQGWVSEHRVVLYEKVGPGPQVCHWCGVGLVWRQRDSRSGSVTADHLDFDRLNNVPDNLVVSCRRCNANRRGVRTYRHDLVPSRPGTSEGGEIPPENAENP
jgi:hypothetical protein